MKKLLSSILCCLLVFSCIAVMPLSASAANEPNPAFTPGEGDVDANGSLSAYDLILLRKSLLGLSELSPEQTSFCDFNKDGLINILDLVCLKHLLVNKALLNTDEYLLEDFDDLAVGSTIPSTEWAGWPGVNTPDGTNARPIAANGYNGTNALTLYSPDGAGTSGQFSVFVSDKYFTFQNTDFAGKDVRFFEMWVDFSEVKFRKIAFKLRSGGLYGTDYFTDDLDGDSSMVYYIQENGKWVEKSYGGSDGCIESFGNYKGFIRIPINHFVNSGNPIDLETTPVDCFGVWFALAEDTMINKDIVFDNIGFAASNYTQEEKVAYAKEVTDTIAALPSVDQLTLNDEAAVKAARAKVNSYGDDVLALVKNLDVLAAAEVRIKELNDIKDANAANPVLSDKFVLAQDFEAIPAGSTACDFTFTDGVGVNGSRAAKATEFRTTGTYNYDFDIPAAYQFAAGEGAEYMWFHINTNGTKLRKGWITLTDEDGNTYTPDDHAPEDGEFYQQNKDGTWSTQYYQNGKQHGSGDNGCYVDWEGSGYVRIKMSDFGSYNPTKKIKRLRITVKDCVFNYGETPVVYPDTATLILDNFGFSGANLASDMTVGDLLSK